MSQNWVSVMLICDIRIAKHELARFGHPFGKIHHLILVMLVRSPDIVHSSIILHRFGNFFVSRQIGLHLFPSITAYLGHIVLQDNEYYH